MHTRAETCSILFVINSFVACTKHVTGMVNSLLSRTQVCTGCTTRCSTGGDGSLPFEPPPCSWWHAWRPRSSRFHAPSQVRWSTWRALWLNCEGTFTWWMRNWIEEVVFKGWSFCMTSVLFLLPVQGIHPNIEGYMHCNSPCNFLKKQVEEYGACTCGLNFHVLHKWSYHALTMAI